MIMVELRGTHGSMRSHIHERLKDEQRCEHPAELFKTLFFPLVSLPGRTLFNEARNRTFICQSCETKGACCRREVQRLVSAAAMHGWTARLTPAT